MFTKVKKQSKSKSLLTTLFYCIEHKEAPSRSPVVFPFLKTFSLKLRAQLSDLLALKLKAGRLQTFQAQVVQVILQHIYHLDKCQSVIFFTPVDGRFSRSTGSPFHINSGYKVAKFTFYCDQLTHHCKLLPVCTQLKYLLLNIESTSCPKKFLITANIIMGRVCVYVLFGFPRTIKVEVYDWDRDGR